MVIAHVSDIRVRRGDDGIDVCLRHEAARARQVDEHLGKVPPVLGAKASSSRGCRQHSGAPYGTNGGSIILARTLSQLSMSSPVWWNTPEVQRCTEHSRTTS